MAKGGIFLLSNDYLVRLEPEKENEIIKYKPDSVKLLPNTVYLSWRLNNFYDTLGVIENGEQISFKGISKLPRAGSLLQDKPIAASWSSFIGFGPKAFYNSILQPSLFIKGYPLFFFYYIFYLISLFRYTCLDKISFLVQL